MPQTAYYSIVQYMPDRGRAEGTNVGVVVWVPETKEIDSVFAHNKCDCEMFTMGLSRRLQMEIWDTLKDMQHFIDTRANLLHMTDARPMRLDRKLSDELDVLMEELVL